MTDRATPMIHPLSQVGVRSQVGANTRIWQYTIVLDGASIGEDCNVCSHVFIEADVLVGDRVTIKSGVQLWNGLRIGNDVFIGPNASFTNDVFPRSRDHSRAPEPTIIRDGASIGANATILPGLSIGEQAMIGAGAVVTRSVPPRAIVQGNPARVVGYVDTADAGPASISPPENAAHSSTPTRVKRVTLHELPRIRDIRGSLTVAEFDGSIPFTPKRIFAVFDVPSVETRGEHAHFTCQEFLICLKGECSVIADDGQTRQEFRLDRPNLGILIPDMTWVIHYKYSPDAVLAVLASDHYQNEDYIRDYTSFLELVRERS